MERDENQKLIINEYSATPSIPYFLSLAHSFFCFALSSAITGPTLLNLESQNNGTIDKLSYIFLVRSISALLGNIFAGIIIDKYMHFGKSLLCLSVCLMGTTTALIPCIFNLSLLIIVEIFFGIGVGMTTNFAQILLLKACSKNKVGTYLHGLHFAFALGILAAPLIAAPFLSKSPSDRRWHYIYYIIALVFLTDVLWLLFYSIRDEWISLKGKTKNEKIYEERRSSSIKTDGDSYAHDEQKNKWRNIFSIALLFLTLSMVIGCERGYISFLYTYARVYLNFETHWAAYLNATFGFSLAIGRLAGVFGTLVLKSNHLILIDMTGCLIAFTLLGLFSNSSSIAWIGTIIYGFFVASLVPATIDWTQSHFHVTGKLLTILFAGGAVGAGTIPLLIGQFFSSALFIPFVLIIVSLVTMILATLFYIVTLSLSLYY
ncbi:hypothetical protein I4U23_016742 [Adineta vaga]|nr:hypothetical protein I4U23_016742 [Adineta vaga]